jgi:acyl-CoA hydrolase
MAPIDRLRGAPARPGRRLVLVAGLAGALSLSFALAGCGRRKPGARPVPRGSTVLALGDSLTHGTGAPPEAAWPAVLAALTGWNVINAGVPGDTSAQALQRLPALLDEHRPALVLVGLGGNDFLRRLDPEATRTNLRRIGEASLAAGAQVLLIAVPRPTALAAFAGALGDHPLYEQLADEMKWPLHPGAKGGWAEVLGDERLRSDAIHANAEGYARFAQGLRATVRSVGLLPE